MAAFTITVLGRGEEIEYAEDSARYIFEVSFSRLPYRLYAYQYWTYPLPTGPIRLLDEKKYIAERVARWMSNDGNPTELIWDPEAYRHPLKSADELLAERLARRDSR